MKKCSGWFDGTKPSYTIKYAEKTPAKAEGELKVQPLKIKKAQIPGGPASVIKTPLTPSPLLQRESREWKPSSQFFKPLNAGLFDREKSLKRSFVFTSCLFTFFKDGSEKLSTTEMKMEAYAPKHEKWFTMPLYKELVNPELSNLNLN